MGDMDDDDDDLGLCVLKYIVIHVVWCLTIVVMV